MPYGTPTRPAPAAGSPVALRDGTLHIDVIDAGSAVREPQVLPDDLVDRPSDGGRGLWLVGRLATAWGWHDTGTGRVVWFRLSDADT
ncbi:ATP-binding protein [Sphaerimonospora sp. CA-214678]|uniref:ATP-binding protein n=1 Tax=Sphaerimonospora sp. CA-214678 TaxID=3240029 RepID=UPI003D8BC053